MKLIVVADIFGRTDVFVELAGELGKSYQMVELLDPYPRGHHGFADEKEAYSYFKDNVGLEEYSHKLAELLAPEKHAACHVVGFSVGASALWLNSDKPLYHPQTKLFGFYSSQVRNYRHIKPQIETTLFFPKQEDHFDVGALIQELKTYRGVSCYQTDYLHGFMNKKSLNYSEEGYRKYLQLMQKMKEE